MLVALPLFYPQAPNRSESHIAGANLYHSCSIAVRLQDVPNTLDADYGAASSCLDYIDGYLDGLKVAQDKTFCMSGASLGTLARVYTVYMAKHPKLLDDPKWAGLNNALVEAYPCPVHK